MFEEEEGEWEGGGEYEYEYGSNNHGEDEENDFDAVVIENEVRGAMRSALSTQQESELLRKELSAYVEDLTQRKGSDGKALIKVPSNFGAVVNSMTREDVHSKADSSGAPPWSQYLLLDGLNTEDDNEFNGRYAQMFRDTPDVKIKRGLAQIEMLDRQLKETAKRSAAEQPADSIDADSVQDHTFVTANRLTGRSPRAGNEAIPESARTTDRSRRNRPSAKSTQQSERKQQQQWLVEDLSGESTLELERRLGSYWDAETVEQTRAIDLQLAQYGHFDRLQDAGLEEDEEEEEDPKARSRMAPGSGEQRDYLAQQREVRRAAERAQRVDDLLQQYTAQPIDFDALAACGEGSGSNRGKATGLASCYSVAEVPLAVFVRADRKVTRSDIEQLVAELCLPASAPSPATAECDGPEDVNSNTVSMSPISARTEQLRLQTVDKKGVQDLVRRYKSEVQALARARTRAGAAGDGGERGSADLPAYNNAQGKTNSPTAAAAPPFRSPAVERAWLLDWGEEAPPSTINMAHSAVVQHGDRRSTNNRNEVPQMHTAAGRNSSGDGAQYEEGWLPPLPPRSADGASASSTSRPGSSAGLLSSTNSGRRTPKEQQPTQQRSPNAKTIRLLPETVSPSTVFRAGAGAGGAGAGTAGAGAGYARQSPRQQHQRQQNRATKANNVLNSMSTFLSREVLAATDHGDTLRI